MTDALNKWATWQEIHRQPVVWRDWGSTLDVAGMRAWIAGQTFDEVWFCGAGTSAYIGDIIAASIKGTRAIATTDIVADPTHILTGARPLIVNFGRSGNSAETRGTLDALDAILPNAPRINITCNKTGMLATRRSDAPVQVIVLPEATHDAGFAMTSSFSTMLLTALALFDQANDIEQRFDFMANQLEKLFPLLKNIDRPERAVFVGSGPLAFAAREASLKVMELSAGLIPSLWDSTLGFRHGPKSFVKENTAITIFVSPHHPTRGYDIDLADELRGQFPHATVQTIGPDGDIDVKMPFGSTWAAPLCVAAAQVRGVIWAQDLGLDVDNPFVGQGTLTRVVSGVKLYPVTS